MKFLLIFTIIVGLLFFATDVLSQDNCTKGGINFGKIVAFVQENIANGKIPICDDGFKANLIGESLTCIESKSVAEGFARIGENEDKAKFKTEVPSSGSSANIAPDCPSMGCPENAYCKPGDHLVKFAENCCCVKEDIFVKP